MSLSTYVDELELKLRIGSDGTTFSWHHQEGAVHKTAISAEKAYVGLKSGSPWTSNKSETKKVLEMWRNPEETIGRFMPDGRRLSMKERCYYRLCYIMLTRLIAAQGELSVDDRKITLSDFSVLEQTNIGDKKPYEIIAEVSTSKPQNKKRYQYRTSNKSDDEEESQCRKIIPFVSDITNHSALELAIRECVPSDQLAVLPIALLRAMVSKNTTVFDFIDSVGRLYKSFKTTSASVQLIDNGVEENKKNAEAERDLKKKKEDQILELEKKKEEQILELDKKKNEQNLQLDKQKQEQKLELEKKKEEIEIEIKKKKEETEIEKNTKDADSERVLKHAREIERIKRETKYIHGATRRQKKVINFTDQRAQILDIWQANFSFGDTERDEMILCTAHHEPRQFHFISIFDALAFDTELGEPSEDRR